MNPQRLRAGKAVEETGQPPSPPGTSKVTNPATEPPKTEAPPTDSTQTRIPQILFEGDEPKIPTAKGPAQKFELGDAGRTESPQQQEAKLPESYAPEKAM